MALGKGKNTPKDNPSESNLMAEYKANDTVQRAEAKNLDQAYQQSRKPIPPTMTTLKDGKKLNYKPGQSAGEDWSVGK